MAKRCWTCGMDVEEWSYNCPSCQDLKILRELRKSVKLEFTDASLSSGEVVRFQLSGFPVLQKVQQEAFMVLKKHHPAQCSHISSIIEWGFGEIEWQLFQQTDALRNLEHTLKTSNQLQADEWRIMAEELRRRGVLDESEEFYLKALDLNRLDYRMHVGLAETYLQSNQFEKAKSVLEKSLPHAPVRGFNYKSYSYRLIGHIYACEGNYHEAVAMLRLAIELSPDYRDGCYDYAQYSAVAGQKEDSLAALRKTIKNPLYFSLAQKERNLNTIREDVQCFLSKIALTGKLSPEYNQGFFELAGYWAQVGNTKNCISLLHQLIVREPKFFSIIQNEKTFEPMKEEVQCLLNQLKSEALHKAEEMIGDSECALAAANKVVSEVTTKLGHTYSSSIYNEAEAKFILAKEKIASGEYTDFLEALLIAREAFSISQNAEVEAEKIRKKLAQGKVIRHSRRTRKTWKSSLKFLDLMSKFIFWPVIMMIIVAAGEFLVAIVIAIPYSVFFGGLFIGFLIGLFIGIKEEGGKIKKFFRHRSLRHKLKISKLFKH